MNSLMRAMQKKQQASAILEELQLFEKWCAVGDCYIVGATAYDLIVTPDIDIETFCDNPEPSKIMIQLASLICHPNIVELKYHDYMQTDFQGHYFKLIYVKDKIEWTIDMWLFANDRQGALSRDLVPYMTTYLTAKNREIILNIKEAVLQQELNFSSVFIYQAVMDFGVQTIDEFLIWTKTHSTTVPFHWQPLHT